MGQTIPPSCHVKLGMRLTERGPWIVMVQSGWSINPVLWSVLMLQSGWSIKLTVDQHRRCDLAPQRLTSRWQCFDSHPLKYFKKNFTFTRSDQKVSGLMLWKYSYCTTVLRGHTYRPTTEWCLRRDREDKVFFLVLLQPANELLTAKKKRLTIELCLWTRFANWAVQWNAVSHVVSVK